METIISQKETSPLDCFNNQFTASQKLPLLFPNAPLVTTNGLYLDDLQANHLKYNPIPTYETSNLKP